MADESIADRVQRERNRLLRAEYGTTDLAEIEKIKQLREVQLKEYATLKAAQEAAAREAMSEQQRLTTDLEAAHATIKQLQDQLADVQQGQIVNEQTQQIQGIAGKYVDQDLLWASMIKFQAYLNGLDPREHKRITPRSIDRWFAKFIEDNPKFKIQPTVMTQPDGTVVTNGTAAVGNRGADSPGPSPATVVKPRVVPRKVGITTNAQPKGGPPAPKATTPAAGTVQGKTPKPGQANSMNNQELKSYLRGRGIRPW